MSTLSRKQTFQLVLDNRHQYDLFGILSGLFKPFQNRWMNQQQAKQVLEASTFNDHYFPWVFTLKVNPQQAEHVSKHIGGSILLTNQYRFPLARMQIEELFSWNPYEEAIGTLNSDDPNHPYLKWMLQSNFRYAISGPLVSVNKYRDPRFTDFSGTPSAIKDEFRTRGWKEIVAFQTRNPLHRSHVAVIQSAASKLSADCGILLHPVVGPTQDIDIDPATRMRCYQALMRTDILHPSKTLIRVLPLAMRMAGPKEATMHAIIRRNVGCTHFIVGRDHAGPSYKKQNGSNFYHPYEAQEYCTKHQDKLGIKILTLEEYVFHKTQKEYIPMSKVPSDQQQCISGTKLRELLAENKNIPEWFSYPAVTKILQERMHANHVYMPGICFYAVGRSGAGKTTLVEELRAKLLEQGFMRPITILDGDELRTNLSPDIGFSRGDRSCHVRRVGYVANLLVQTGTTVFVSNIAPFENDRQYNRRQIMNYRQVFCNSSIEICRKRDPKGLYADSVEDNIAQRDEKIGTFEEPFINEFVVNEKNWTETIQQILININQHYNNVGI